MWKIVAVDTMGRDSDSDILIAENFSDLEIAVDAAQHLEDRALGGEYRDMYFAVVPDSYPLYTAEREAEERT